MKHIAFILDRFELQSPGQQLLDRFLIGYNVDGDFRRPEAHVTVHIRENVDSKLLGQRSTEFGLKIANSIESALEGAEGVVFAPGSKTNSGPTPLGTLGQSPKGGRAYVDTALIGDSNSLEQLEQLAKSRSITLACGSIAAHFFPLPVKPKFGGHEVTKALIVAQGEFPRAEREALHSLAPYFDYTKLRIRDVRKVRNAEVWSEAYSPAWRELFASAVSRSNTIQGDPEKDGRTQNIVGLQLAETLAREPRGWLLRHENGLETLVLVLDGALADFNFAVLAGRQIHSAQLFRAPAPLEDHYSNLAGWIDQFFRSGQPGESLAAARYVAQTIDRISSGQMAN